jgi:hypothetical protein
MGNKTTYTVTLTFTDISEDSPLLATKQVIKYIEDDVSQLMFNVTDELSNEKFVVDMADESTDKI